MNDKKPVWSESLNGSRAHLDDGLIGLDEKNDTDTTHTVTRRGVVLVANCVGDAQVKDTGAGCGRQMKAVMTFGEVLAWWNRVPMQGTAYARQGAITRLRCSCGKTTPMLVNWNEVRDWLDFAVRNGSLPPQVAPRR
jgi:hypothetical protein